MLYPIQKREKAGFRMKMNLSRCRLGLDEPGVIICALLILGILLPAGTGNRNPMVISHRHITA